jgi:hypothetical protein
MAARIIVVATVLVVLTIFHQDPSAQHKINAASRHAINTETNASRLTAVEPEPLSGSAWQGLTEEIERPVEQSCYAFMRRRPPSQRADAVQARLRHVDRMTTAFDPNLLTVDILGDHANILSLEVPVVWPDRLGYVSRVSSVVDDYLSSPAIKDFLCQSGFDEVRLLARGVNDEQSHLIWRAQVTTDGLVKLGRHGFSRATPGVLSATGPEETAMVLHK